MASVQDSKRTNDAVMTTVSVIIFRPALFAVKRDGATAAEHSQLKGQMQADSAGVDDEEVRHSVHAEWPPRRPAHQRACNGCIARSIDLSEQ